MKKEEYAAKRKELMDQAQILIDEDKIDESNAKLNEVKELDQKWDAIKLANANIAALKGAGEPVDLQNKSVRVDGAVAIEETTVKDEKVDKKTQYLNAWAKVMQGHKLDKAEQEIFNAKKIEFSNAYTHSTTNTAVLIPETVVAGIWKRAEEMYPFLGDAKKFNISGTLTLKKHNGIKAGDAKFYTEGTPTEDEENEFGEIKLAGHELAKAITVTWKLRSMATEEFIPFIIAELGERVGIAMGTASYSGNGTNEPEGVETALIAEAAKPQIVTYNPDATTPIPLTYAKLVLTISKIHSSYLSGCAIYAKNSTIWTELATLLDDNGRPLFIPDVTSGGVGRMFGMVVKPDAGISNKNILIGNPNAGYIINTNEPMSVATEEHVKARTVDYAAYTIVDGAVLDNKAFALIQDLPNA
jgi:HK97 family phage major capsid protein